MTFLDRRLLTHLNWSLLLSLALLYACGLVNLYSACSDRVDDAFILSPYFHRQITWGAGGCVVMLAAMSFDYRRLRNVSHFLYAIAIVTLLLVPVSGKVVMGARRWLDLGLFQFQPSEIAKVAVLVLGAQILAKDGLPLGWASIAQLSGLAVVPAALIVLQPDLGTALTLLFILGGMIVYHGVTKGVLKGVMVGLPCILPVAWLTLHDYQKRRLITFLDPSHDPLGAGYHITQAKIAIGSGQVTGKGWLQGTQSQLRFLPEKHTDFVVAVFGEEWGFVGCLLLMGLFCCFLFCIFSTVREAKDRFGSTLAAGILIYFFWQIAINTGMVLGLLPVVGIPLPFLSYGGSAMLQNFALAGLVLNISMRKFMFKG